MCGMDPMLGALVIGISTGFFALLSINFANVYKKRKAMKLEGEENA